MSFKIEKDFFKLMNNSVYGKTINGKINAKNMVHIKMNSWTDKKEKKLFQELPFYNRLIEKPKITNLKNIGLLHEVPFYDELNIMQIS